LRVACREMAEGVIEIEGQMVRRIVGGHGGEKR
jgi:hypothetical protein